MPHIHPMYLVYTHGSKRDFSKADFVQKFLFKIYPEKGRPVFTVKAHFLLLEWNKGFLFCLSWSTRERTAPRPTSFQAKKMREGWERRETGTVGLQLGFCGKAQGFQWNLPHGSAGTRSTQGANKCSAGFLSKQLGDWGTKIRGRQTSALENLLCKHFQKPAQNLFKHSAVVFTTQVKCSPVCTLLLPSLLAHSQLSIPTAVYSSHIWEQ